MNARRAAESPARKPWFWGFVGRTILATLVAWLTLVALSIALALLFGGALLGLIGMGSSGDTPAAEETAPTDAQTEEGQMIGPPPEETADTATVLLEGTSTGPANITWDEPGSYGNSVDIEAGPWSLEIPESDPLGGYYVSVTHTGVDAPADLTCTITIDGEQADTGTASGVGAIASCDA